MIVGRYITIGFIFTPMNAVSIMVLPPDKVRMGSGLVNLVQQGLGGTIGLAIMTTYLQNRTAYHATVLGQEQTSSSLPWEDILAPVHGLLAQAGDVGTMVQVKAMAMVQRHLMEQATIAAYQDAFVLVVILCITVAPLVLFLRPRRNP
jgi:MFS transporter, DHA2 family, multidrug resistance protein